MVLGLVGAGHLVPYSDVNAPEAGPEALKDSVYRRLSPGLRRISSKLSFPRRRQLGRLRRLVGESRRRPERRRGYVRAHAPIAAGYCPGAPG